MNIELVKQEIENLLKDVKQPTRKQYPISKKQETELKELGLFEIMKNRKYAYGSVGHTNAKIIIEAAKDSGGKDVGGWTSYADADFTSSRASKLFQLLNTKNEQAVRKTWLEAAFQNMLDGGK